jgi:hypothetical protein
LFKSRNDNIINNNNPEQVEEQLIREHAASQIEIEKANYSQESNGERIMRFYNLVQAISSRLG